MSKERKRAYQFLFLGLVCLFMAMRPLLPTWVTASLLGVMVLFQIFLSAVRPRFALVACGGILNCFAVFSNGGRMPVLRSVAPHDVIWGNSHFPFVNPASVRFYWLCDILPFGFSVGDAVIGLGVLIVLSAMLSKDKKAA